MRTALLVVALALAGAGLAAGAGPADEGKTIFQKDCGSCHTIGRGDSVGPDLKGVTKTVGADAVKRFVAAPDKEIASGDPRIAALVKKFRGVKMPNFHLTPAQVDAVVAYLQAQAGGAPSPPSRPAPGGGAKGDAAAGERLFSGAAALAHGGPACVSCHTVAGIGALGGGKVGPDLSKAYAKYGGARGAASVLTTIAFPTMIPVYRNHALTKREAANLAAFLGTASASRTASDRAWLLVLLGLGVTAAFGVLALAVWPRRRLVVRRRLVPSTRPKG